VKNVKLNRIKKKNTKIWLLLTSMFFVVEQTKKGREKNWLSLMNRMPKKPTEKKKMQRATILSSFLDVFFFV
jgi:hypothetical protein